jgi:thiol-disulfide isomerase/thioredoxin
MSSFTFIFFIVSLFISFKGWCELDKAVSVPPPISHPVSTMASVLNDSLVVPNKAQTGSFVPFTTTDYDYYLVYFSAHWCGPCRQFTPKLVTYYQEKALDTHKIQVIFVSLDDTLSSMYDYMVNMKMPWPAVNYQKIKSIDFLKKIQGPGIPQLVLLDKNGHVLANSFEKGQSLGPQSVLDYVSKQLLLK